MKILYCVLGTFNSGGIERILAAKANWLVQHGHEIYIVTTEQNNKKDFFVLDNRVKRIDLNILYSSIQGVNPIKKYLDRRKRMKIHQQKLKKVIFETDPDIIISTFGNEVSLLPNIHHRAKKIVEIHFSKWYRIQLNRPGIYKFIDQVLTWQDAKIAKKYDRLVVLTEEDKLNWKNILNIEVIPNFIEKRANEPALLESKSMIAVGRLYYQKGFDRLINAWNLVVKKHPDWILNIFGAGELEKDLINYIRELNLEQNIKIYPPTSEIDSEYKKSSAIILSSRYEGLPMVLLESMSVGVPPISYTCQCGPKDVISDYHDGILVEEGDIQGLADKILLLIEDKKLRKDLGLNSYIKSKNYLVDNIMTKWMTLFSDILNF